MVGKFIWQGTEHAVYRRSSLHNLYSREGWIKKCRAVKDNEVPLKWKDVSVLASSQQVSHERQKSRVMKAVGLFAMWQTRLYDPSEAKDGIVPKNTRGQINLWTPAHLPRKCVHVLEADAAMIARKLGIDYATAVAGFDFSGMIVTPKLNGIIIAADNTGILKEGLKHHFKVAKSRTDRMAFATLCKHWRLLIRGSISALKFQHREKSASLRRVIAPINAENKKIQSQSCQEKREQEEFFSSEHRMRSIITDGHVHYFTASFSASGEWIQLCACGVSSTD